MLVTLIIEVVFAFYILFRYKLTSAHRLVVSILFFLAIFQGVEYLVCATEATAPWPQIGFIAITLLPPLGLHLVYHLLGKRPPLYFFYGLATVLSLALTFIPEIIVSPFCTNSYAIFQLSQPMATLYFVYYFALLLWGLGEIVDSIVEHRANKKKRTMLLLIGVGYLSFMLPMGVLSLLLAETREAIPSIMCGFAIVFAFVLTFGVAPLLSKSEK